MERSLLMVVVLVRHYSCVCVFFFYSCLKTENSLALQPCRGSKEQLARYSTTVEYGGRQYPC